MNDEMMRRISDALDGGGGMEADKDLSAALADDPEAAAYAADCVRVDAALAKLANDSEPDWEALASRIEARLDEDLEELDIDAAPRFLDDDRPIEKPAPKQAAAAKASPPREGAKVVDLTARRASHVLYWFGGLAAAAAVGLGISVGLFTQSAEEAPMASGVLEPAPAMQEAAPMPATPLPEPIGARSDDAPGWEGADRAMAEAPAEPMGAVATAQPQPTPFGDSEQRARAVAPTTSVSRGGGGSGYEMRAPRPQAIMPTPQPSASPTPIRGSENIDPFGSSGRAAPEQRPLRARAVEQLASVHENVQRCMGEHRDAAQVSVRVAADGSIQSVAVTPYTGQEASCIEGQVRTVQMPANSESYVTRHTYRPGPIAGGSLARPPAAARRSVRESSSEAINPFKKPD